MTTTTSPLRIFVCYNYPDYEYCKKYVARLKAAGLDVWYDQARLGPGGTLRTVFRNGVYQVIGDKDGPIEIELRSRQYFVAIVSPAALTSDWINAEIDTALHFVASGQMQKAFLVVAEPYKLPPTLSAFQRIEGRFEGPIGAEEAADKTIQALLPQGARTPYGRGWRARGG